jgi:hypothetical protein
VEIKQLPVYETPEVVSYTDEDILDELGPAWAQFSPILAGPPPPASPYN